MEIYENLSIESLPNEEWRKRNRENVKKAMARPEVRKKISESRKLNWQTPEYMHMQKNRHVNKSVLQFDLEMNFIRGFISINEASRESGVNSTSIVRCCKRKQNKAGNYVWRYTND